MSSTQDSLRASDVVAPPAIIPSRRRGWALPSTQLRRNRRFYLLYDGAWAVALAAFCAALARIHPAPVLGRPSPFALALALPLACHALILAHVWIHNATHGAFPRAINRLVGELLGLAVITRFASWEIVHQRHHRYSDDPERDPHPVQRSYWRYARFTVVNVERQLQRAHFDLYGDTEATRRFERRRAWVSYLCNVALLVTWHRVLGSWAFFAVFLPANLVAALHVIHFNWVTHNARSPDGDFHPVNLDHGLFRLGNLLWHGIYLHANHHRRPAAFNPRTVSTAEALRAAQAGL